jgi:hypothetical protein
MHPDETPFYDTPPYFNYDYILKNKTFVNQQSLEGVKCRFEEMFVYNVFDSSWIKKKCAMEFQMVIARLWLFGSWFDVFAFLTRSGLDLAYGVRSDGRSLHRLQRYLIRLYHAFGVPKQEAQVDPFENTPPCYHFDLMQIKARYAHFGGAIVMVTDEYYGHEDQDRCAKCVWRRLVKNHTTYAYHLHEKNYNQLERQLWKQVQDIAKTTT